MTKKSKINRIYCCDCLVGMKRVKDDVIDLTVTSPPYDDLRNYKGYDFNFKEIAKQLYRITKPGGVVVWVVGDAVVKGGETGSSFRQALYFMECGFKLHDTMIFEKNTSAFPARRNGNRYTQIFEYMFVFSKGAPKTANLISDKLNRWQGYTNWGANSIRKKDGTLEKTGDIKPVPEFSPRNNIWHFCVNKNYLTKDKEAHAHPAMFPEKLAHDHIITWTNEGDLVFDPMCGAGTTCKAAKILKRKFIGFDTSAEYCKIATERVEHSDKLQLHLPDYYGKKPSDQKQADLPKKGTLRGV